MTAAYFGLSRSSRIPFRRSGMSTGHPLLQYALSSALSLGCLLCGDGLGRRARASQGGGGRCCCCLQGTALLKHRFELHSRLHGQRSCVLYLPYRTLPSHLTPVNRTCSLRQSASRQALTFCGERLGHSVTICYHMTLLMNHLTEVTCSCRAALRGRDVVIAICPVEQTLMGKGRIGQRDVLLLFDP